MIYGCCSCFCVWCCCRCRCRCCCCWVAASSSSSSYRMTILYHEHCTLIPLMILNIYKTVCRDRLTKYTLGTSGTLDRLSSGIGICSPECQIISLASIFRPHRPYIQNTVRHTVYAQKKTASSPKTSPSGSYPAQTSVISEWCSNCQGSEKSTAW